MVHAATTSERATLPARADGFGAGFLAPLLLASTLNPLNSSILATGLVSIARDMHVSPPSATSLVAVMYLSSAISQPAMGKVSLRWGARLVFVYGLAVVVIGAALGVVAPNMASLLLSRVLIGAGTSAAYPTSVAMIRDRAIGLGVDVPSMPMALLAIAGQATSALGLPLGGLLIGLAGWRIMFLINIPLALAGIVAALVWLPRDRKLATKDLARGLDLVGIALFALTITSLLGLLGDLQGSRWWVAVVCLAGGATLVAWERRCSDPFIDVRMLAANAPLRRTYIRNGLSFIAVYTVLYGVSQWLETARGLEPQQCGLVLLPMIVVSGLTSAAVARFNKVRASLILAGTAFGLGGALLLTWTAGVASVVLYAVTVVLGVGMGSAFIANQVALYRQADGPDIAVAIGLLRTSSYVAAILSSSVIAIAFTRNGLHAGLQVLAWLTLGIGLVVALSPVADRSLVEPTAIIESTGEW